MKFVVKLEIYVDMKFKRNLKFASGIWNIVVILLSDWPLGHVHPHVAVNSTYKAKKLLGLECDWVSYSILDVESI